jgi:hypothetical protein
MRPRANERQRRRAAEDANELWCSFGKHTTRRRFEVKEQYPTATICFRCQVSVMENLEKSLFMPELSEAILLRKRAAWELERKRAVTEGDLRRHAPDMEGIVYYLRINGTVKIGYTTNLTRRSRAYPPGSELLAVEPGTPDTEKERHQQFRNYLTRGREWFVEAPAILDHTERLRGLYGLPSALMHNYTKHHTAKGSTSA